MLRPDCNAGRLSAGVRKMDFDLKLSIAMLERTPPTLRVLLHGLPEEWALSTNGPGSWSAYDVVGHLIHGERTDWLPRLRIILEYGATRAFERFDREAMFEASHGKSLEQRLDDFAELRAMNLDALRELRLTREHYALRGTHPVFGEVTLAQLLATWTAHDLSHIVQIARTMARQYRTAVGPWTEYISILQ